MAYVYIQSEPRLWTVGHYDRDGHFEPESDHASPDAAAAHAAWLNGAGPNPAALRTNYQPNPDTPDVVAAQARLHRAVLSAILASEYGPEGDPNYAASVEHADEEVALAARDLTQAINALPKDERPVGWNKDGAA